MPSKCRYLQMAGSVPLCTVSVLGFQQCSSSQDHKCCLVVPRQPGRQGNSSQHRTDLLAWTTLSLHSRCLLCNLHSQPEQHFQKKLRKFPQDKVSRQHYQLRSSDQLDIHRLHPHLTVSLEQNRLCRSDRVRIVRLEQKDRQKHSSCPRCMPLVPMIPVDKRYHCCTVLDQMYPQGNTTPSDTLSATAKLAMHNIGLLDTPCNPLLLLDFPLHHKCPPDKRQEIQTLRHTSSLVDSRI